MSYIHGNGGWIIKVILSLVGIVITASINIVDLQVLQFDTYGIFTHTIKCMQTMEVLSFSFFVPQLLFYFSDRLLSVLRGHSFFSSPPQQPMTSDFEGFSIPDFIHYIYFPIFQYNYIKYAIRVKIHYCRSILDLFAYYVKLQDHCIQRSERKEFLLLLSSAHCELFRFQPSTSIFLIYVIFIVT